MSDEAKLVNLLNGDVEEEIEVALMVDNIRSLLKQNHRALLELIRFAKYKVPPGKNVIGTLGQYNLLADNSLVSELAVKVVNSMNYDGKLEKSLVNEMLSGSRVYVTLPNPIKPDEDDLIKLLDE